MADQVGSRILTLLDEQSAEEGAELGARLGALRRPDRGQDLRDRELVKDRRLRRFELDLRIDDLEGIVMGEFLDQIGFAAVDEGTHQAVDDGIDHRLAPLRDHLRQKGLLRSEEHTSELQSLMRISYAVFCLK